MKYYILIYEKITLVSSKRCGEKFEIRAIGFWKKKYKIRKKNIVKKLRANVDLFLVNLLDVAVQSLRTDIKQDGIDRRVVRLSALHRHV